MNCSCKKVLAIYVCFMGKLRIVVSQSVFNKVVDVSPRTLLKETPTQVFSYEICKTFKNTYFEENLPTSASHEPNKVSIYYQFKSFLQFDRKGLNEETYSKW